MCTRIENLFSYFIFGKWAEEQRIGAVHCLATRWRESHLNCVLNANAAIKKIIEFYMCMQPWLKIYLVQQNKT